MMLYTMIIVALVIAVVLIWMEIKRPSRSFLVWRLVASLTAVIALLMLVVPFPYSKNKIIGKEIILLTEGYQQDSVDQFQKKSPQSLQQLQLNNFTVDQLAGISKIHLFGNGFKDTDQVQLPNIPIQFHPTASQTGIQTIHWQKNIFSGASLLVQGSCLNLSSKTAKLVLYGWNKRLDSMTIEAGKQLPFSFSVVPENLGRGLFHLAMITGKDSLEKETIAYEVKPAKALKVLMLTASPDFETKFLQNWLADLGYTVISKTGVSKEKYQKTFSNTTPSNIDQLTTTFLAAQDLIVSDEATIQTLPASELAILKQAISEKGIGLILNADSTLSKKNFVGEVFSLKSADSNKVSIKISRLGESNTTAAIGLKQPFQIIEKEGTQPLFIDQQKRVFASVAVFGKGKLIMNTLQKTSSWLLSGNKNDYRNYWTTLIDRSAKKEASSEIWDIKTELPRVHEAIVIAAETNNLNPPQLTIQQHESYAKQNALMPGFWEATDWPMQAGWQTMIGSNATIKDWYVYAAGSWRSIYAKKQISETKSYLKNRLSAGSFKPGDLNPDNQIPPIYWFLIFMLSMVFLWVERKFQ